MSEEWQCKIFERGLRHNLMKVTVPMRIREFPLLVEQAKMIEQLEVDPHQVMRSHTMEIAMEGGNKRNPTLDLSRVDRDQ